jgi:hypothetical protein
MASVRMLDLRHDEVTMGDLLTNISNTVDRRRPRVVFADGGSVPIWIVRHH